MSIEKVLIVEDDKLGRDFTADALERLGLATVSAANAREASELLNTENVDLVLADLRLPEIDGVQLLRTLKRQRPELPVMLMQAFGTADGAVEALREGAEDVLLKPFGADQIRLMLERLQRRMQLTLENRYLRTAVEVDHPASEMVGSCAAILEVSARIARVAPSKATVLVQGEPGTGKHLVAKILHEASSRKDRTLVHVDCSRHCEGMLESELFGDDRGVAPGAEQRRLGKFELANHGTLVLHEIIELPPSLQVKLLRTLEEEQLERAGSSRRIPVDVRVIVTSPRTLAQATKDGSLREDLYRRLQVSTIDLPALRDRKDDILPLVQCFLKRFGLRRNRPIASITESAVEALKQYHWPNNVRELIQVIQRAVVCSGARAINVDDLGLPAAGTGSPQVGRKVEDVERELILRTLTATHGNRTRAADVLGVTPRTICNKIRLYRAQGCHIPEPQRPGKEKEQELVLAGTTATGPSETEWHQG